MVPHTQTEGIVTEEERKFSSAPTVQEVAPVRNLAGEFAATLSWLPERPSSEMFSERGQNLLLKFEDLVDGIDDAYAANSESEDLLWLRTNAQQLSSAARAITAELTAQSLPVVATRVEILPRSLAIAKGFLDQVDIHFKKPQFTAFCLAFEEVTPLEFHEIGALVPALKLVLLERIAELAMVLLKDPARPTEERVVPLIRSYQHVAQASWRDDLESLIPFDSSLRKDPAGAYARMDLDTRNSYRERVAQVAKRSDLTEMQVVNAALKLAERAKARGNSDPRIAERESHIGYYLVSEGSDELCQKVGYHPPFNEHLRHALRTHPDEFLLVGIAVLTFCIVAGILSILTAPDMPLHIVLLSMLILILPSSQAAVQLMNYLATNLLRPSALPKLDFSEGVPDDCVTLVAIPTLLLNEGQVQHLVDELEVRYLGNHDHNLHFAIVSDMPDSPHPAPENNELVELCSRLITELNELYAAKGSGTFFHLHRHRVYNPREKGWMGWERKRGKLLDLNQLLRGQFDSFPVKIGDLSILPSDAIRHHTGFRH